MSSATYKNFYENLEEAQFRLLGTVVRYDGEPAFIHQVRNHDDGVYRLNISILPNSLDEDRAMAFVDESDEDAVPGPRIVRKKINSPRFDKFRPFELGWCNYMPNGEVARYLTRVPSRRSKQGLAGESLTVQSPVSHIDKRVPSFLELVKNSAFRETVMDEYPSFEEAMDTLGPSRVVGVSREFAIEEDQGGMRFLYYKLERVAVVRDSEILLSPRKSFLRESITGCRNLLNNINTL